MAKKKKEIAEQVPDVPLCPVCKGEGGVAEALLIMEHGKRMKGAGK